MKRRKRSKGRKREICGMCGGVNDSSTSGICRNCKRVYDKIKRRVLREYVNFYLDHNPCVDCGEARLTVLEFDHVKGKDKNVGTFVGQGASFRKLQNEIDKCEVRCSNCHSHRHRKSLPHYKLEDLDIGETK